MGVSAERDLSLIVQVEEKLSKKGLLVSFDN